MDRETVIRDLEYLVSFGGASQQSMVMKIATEALILLKEQETKFICNLLGSQPYEVYCRECRTIVCQLSKGDTMDTVKKVFNFCPQCGKKVKWE